ncbi:MAG: hypothetical protein JSU77_04015 [Fidelibacterota bacterium]|nr:MAG: hypothetical protein JSU77_04015 [Candidatus Neomarinimicrobiota bacterium]
MIPKVQFNRSEILPEREAVLRFQGMANGVTVQGHVSALIDEALDIFSKTCEPIGIIAELSTNEFREIFRGEGENNSDTPLAHIFPQADALALFALTVGAEVSGGIEKLFAEDDFALGYMLDTVASLAADKAVEVCESSFLHDLVQRGLAQSDHRALSYSPGYCGWHLTGQKKLFQYLQPEKIQITLNDSCLMTPLKSVTGVLVTGRKDIHLFQTSYAFCRDCRTYSCRQRMKELMSA